MREKYPLLFLTARAPGHGELPVKLFLDLVEANRRQLLDAGVLAKNIDTAAPCTVLPSGAAVQLSGGEGRNGKNDGGGRDQELTSTMPYRVISFTMAQVRQGALEFQRDLSAVLRELPEIKVYSLSPFDLDERRRFKDRFGGDIVYFFNDAAREECERLGLDLQYLAEISDEELPRRRTLVVGMPERTARSLTRNSTAIRRTRTLVLLCFLARCRTWACRPFLRILTVLLWNPSLPSRCSRFPKKRNEDEAEDGPLLRIVGHVPARALELHRRSRDHLLHDAPAFGALLAVACRKICGFLQSGVRTSCTGIRRWACVSVILEAGIHRRQFRRACDSWNVITVSADPPARARRARGNISPTPDISPRRLRTWHKPRCDRTCVRREWYAARRCRPPRQSPS